MASIIVDDYKVVLCNIYDSEELKIDYYCRMIQTTIEQLCSPTQFKQRYLEVLEATRRIVEKAKKSEPFFREMFLYLDEDLPSTVANLSCNQRDHILWQVCYWI